MQKIVRKIKKIFLSVQSGGIYMLLIAISIAIATFIENDFGTNTAQKLIFKSWWFELILILFALSSIYNVILFKMYKLKKWPIFLFHLSIPFIVIGAGVTRYFGIEGSMHIREGAKTNKITTRDAYLNFDVTEGNNKYKINEKILFSSLGKNKFNKSYLFGNKELNVELIDIIPNPEIQILEDGIGTPTLKIVIATNNGRQDELLEFGETNNLSGIPFNFNSNIVENAVNIKSQNDTLYILYHKPMEVMEMTSRNITKLSQNEWHILQMKSLYSGLGKNIVFRDFYKSANKSWKSKSKKLDSKSKLLIKLKLSSGDETKFIEFIGSEGYISSSKFTLINGINIATSYGPKIIELPFHIKLKDFILKKYIGTNNPSSYESMVEIQDPEKNIKFSYHIYMNHILNYKGYRFFQSSYDPDERGSILSVNHDFYGTIITYIGYFLITIGLIASLFVKNGRMRKLSLKLEKIKNS